MFKSDKFIYVHMKKTAGTHITKLLSQLFEGEMVGTIKHNVATSEHLKSTPYFIGSIRNPWDWYLSLWTFGVAGRGELHYRLTKLELSFMWHTVLKNRYAGLRYLFDKVISEVKKTWHDVYRRSDDIASFRRWLKLIHDPATSRLLADGYGGPGRHIGLMTYYYLVTYCRYGRPKKPLDLGDFEQLRRFDEDACYIDSFIRQEALEESLCAACEPIRTLSPAEKSLVFKAEKTNTSFRSCRIRDYYDQASIDIIQNRDRLIVEKFNYSPPK